MEKTKVDSERIVFYLKRYIPSFAIMGLSTCIILMLRNQGAEESLDIRYLNFADSFTIPAVVMLMVGVLLWVSSQGLFDMITYGLSRGIGSLIPFIRLDNRDERFYDYKQRKEKKRIKGYSFIFICGGIYLIPALVFNILYYTL